MQFLLVIDHDSHGRGIQPVGVFLVDPIIDVMRLGLRDAHPLFDGGPERREVHVIPETRPIRPSGLAPIEDLLKEIVDEDVRLKLLTVGRQLVNAT